MSPFDHFLRNRLKYALTASEVTKIVKKRLIKIDGKVRTDPKFPAGFMDVINIEKTRENFRLLYDPKGRFAVHRINPQEAKFKLCRVKKVRIGVKGIPFLVTHDGRTIRYPHPHVKANDTVKVDIATGKIIDFVKFDTGGHNVGRVGIITHREKHPGSFDIVHVKDKASHSFATRLSNVFIIGKGDHSLVTLLKDKGLRLTVAEERDKRLAVKSSA